MSKRIKAVAMTIKSKTTNQQAMIASRAKLCL